jgi:hypothetical protein
VLDPDTNDRKDSGLEIQPEQASTDSYGDVLLDDDGNDAKRPTEEEK